MLDEETKKRLMATANFKPIYEGFEEYEKKLSEPCFFTGRKCGRDKCPRWMSITAGIPSPVMGARPAPVVLHQCQDDFVMSMIEDLQTWKNIVTQSAMEAQAQAMAQRAQRSRLVPPGFGGPGLS